MEFLGLMSLSPVGIIVPSLCIQIFSALFLCAVVQWCCESRPVMMRLSGEWDWKWVIRAVVSLPVLML